MQAQSWGEETGLVSCQLAAAPLASGAFDYLAHAWKEESHPLFSALHSCPFLSSAALRRPGPFCGMMLVSLGNQMGSVQGREQDSIWAGGGKPTCKWSLAVLPLSSECGRASLGWGQGRHYFLPSVSSGRGLEHAQSATH